jgi:hypothetical protein
MPEDASMDQLMLKLQAYVDSHPDRPWCVHEMFEEVGARHPGEDMLVETQRALNHLARVGRMRTSGMMVERSEGVCDDWFYWSAKASQKHLDEFGPKWQFPALSEKIQAHCRHRV